MQLLLRDEFRQAVFNRDSYRCVICQEQSQDAHHILERRLFSDGGYYLDNGASLCGQCHIDAEKTLISCETIREKTKIKNIILPDHLYKDNRYDKWGNIILINGLRLKGELFFDESVQKILKEGNVLNLFTKYVKYPRTYHLPWSEGKIDDDRTLENINHFVGKNVIVTEKMDGENTTIYTDYIHARSIDAQSHWTQSYVKQLQNKIGFNIPENWRVCGENLYAKHSIGYDKLSDFFLMFSIWNDKNVCLSWGETIEWANLLDLKLVPVLYEDIFDENLVKSLYKNGMEGYVLRLSDSFNYSQFKNSVAKFVRKNHVSTSNHWKYERIEKNSLST